MIFQTSMIMFHVNLPGCMFLFLLLLLLILLILLPIILETFPHLLLGHPKVLATASPGKNGPTLQRQTRNPPLGVRVWKSSKTGCNIPKHSKKKTVYLSTFSSLNYPKCKQDWEYIECVGQEAATNCWISLLIKARMNVNPYHLLPKV